MDKVLTTFKELGVQPEIVEALASIDIEEAFPIQEMALPLALAGTDLIGQARTGTGKTLAFGIPVLQRTVAPGEDGFDELPGANLPQALVVTPTRELALQVADDLAAAGSKRSIRVLTVYGGVSYDPQLDALKSGVDVVVGTPGRLIDLMQRGALNLKQVQVLVLDEADEMLDLGFLPDVERLLAATPKNRQTMLFSATMPGAIISMARDHMNQPMNIRASTTPGPQLVAATTQFVYQAHHLDKPEMLGRLLQADGTDLMIVFTRTKRQAQRLADDLAERGFKTDSLHGDMNQRAREKAMDKFREGKLQVLVATDVAARGIDVDGVTHVVNFNCPDDENTYVHRIGRTGRAGASGVAITLVDWDDLHRWKLINNALELDFAEPQETYSSSEHFLADHSIAAGTKGRLASASKTSSSSTPRRERQRSRGGSRQRSGSQSEPRSGASSRRGDGGSEGASSKPKPRRRRSRQRTRGGKPVS